jgi:hypothetical protein
MRARKNFTQADEELAKCRMDAAQSSGQYPRAARRCVGKSANGVEET